MADDHQSDRQPEPDGVSRRSYVQLLGALGVGSGATAGYTASSTEDGVAAATQDGQFDPDGISVADSGTDVGDGITHLDFEGSLSPVSADDGDDAPRGVRIQSDHDHARPEIVNVHEDLGVEPQDDDVWGAIYDHYQSYEPANRNHRYVIPPGTWHVETDNIELDAHEFVGIVGDPFAILKVTDQDVDRMMTVGTTDTSLPHAQRTVMRDLRVDIRGPYDTGICRWYTYTYGHIENVSMRGQRDRLNPEFGGDRHTIMVDGVRSLTTNVIRSCHLLNGDTAYDRETHVGHAIPFSSEPHNRGTNLWEGCKVQDYVDNGIYVSNNEGRNIIRGCHALNCSGAGIRIGANDYVENCRITMTEPTPYPWSGLWLQDGGGQVVKRLNVQNSIEKTTEIVRLTHDGPAYLSNVHITDEGGDGRVVRVDDDDSTRTVFEGCTITGQTELDTSDYAIYVRSSNVAFQDCEFHFESQTSPDQHGIFVRRNGQDVDRLIMNNTDVRADGAALRFGESGREHAARNAVFDGLVMSDADATLGDVLWLGNRHRGQTVFHGDRPNWQGDFNFGFDI